MGEGDAEARDVEIFEHKCRKKTKKKQIKYK